jgi:hypothetical protein
MQRRRLSRFDLEIGILPSDKSPVQNGKMLVAIELKKKDVSGNELERFLAFTNSIQHCNFWQAPLIVNKDLIEDV